MPNHKDVNYKRITRKILSYGWVMAIRKGFKRWGVEYLLELSSDAMKYLVMEPLRKKWEEDKRTKLENYIANINLECWIQYKARRGLLIIFNLIPLLT